MPPRGKAHSEDAKARIAAGLREYWEEADTSWHRTNIALANDRLVERRKRIEPRWADRDPSEAVSVGITVADCWGIYRSLARHKRREELMERFAAAVDRGLGR